MTEHLLAAQHEVLTLPVIELEDYLVPSRADTLHEQIPNTKLIAKMNDKAALMPSVNWIEQAIAR